MDTPAAPGWTFNPPPGWPVPPPGWRPPPNWRPDPALPAPPPGWQWWVPTDITGATPIPAPVAPPVTVVPVAPPPPTVTGPPEPTALQVEHLRREVTALTARLTELRRTVAETTDVAMLQEIGIYEYSHPLESAAAYQARLATLKERYRAMARDGRAVGHATSWHVNNSAAEGKRMLNDFSKLMLRAYNSEADNLVRSMKPFKLAASSDRLNKTAETIAKLGKSMQIYITTAYHRARLEELSLTADYLSRKAAEREAEREARARQREEEKAKREFEREKERLRKQRDHNLAAMAKLEAKGDVEGVAALAATLDRINADIHSVETREANIRTGYVYVISNIGAFGERMVKVGMTRRLDPMDRVRELGDASVPFRFDVHALIFSADAVSLESKLHKELDDRRVNRVNLRREFFHATPAEVREVLEKLDGEHLLEYQEIPEAEEWRASRSDG
ncbi:hypothetical protein Pen01_75190 [Phytomonospora endophytica]|nr:hypothetical protein Pen01_75190 [Phytomonospora endophytica]